MMLLLSAIFVITIVIITTQDEVCNCSIQNGDINCKKCGSTLKQDYNYCPHCKEQIKKKCEHCGKMIDATWRRCPYCEE